MGGREWGAGRRGKVYATFGRTCKKIQVEERLKKESLKGKKTTKRKHSRTPSSRTINARTGRCLFAFRRFCNGETGLARASKRNT